MNNQILILGGGFGLYGYLPAALQTNWQVTTLSRYKQFIESRTELSGFMDRINFIAEENIDPNSYGGIVIARTPLQQFEFIQQCPSFTGHFFLEKPLGQTPSSTSELLDTLQSRNSTFSVAYLFQYQEWYKEVVSKKISGSKLLIDWKIPLSTIPSWKDIQESGGGILAYFGVHLLSLAIELKHDVDSLRITYAPDSLVIRSIVSPLGLEINLYRGKGSEFKVSISGDNCNYFWNAESPFGIKPTRGTPDPRIPALIEYLSGWRTQINQSESIARERKILEFKQTIFSV